MATIDLGKIKQVWRGTYNNSTAYVVDDLVAYTDSGITSTYICVANSTGNAPSSSGTAHASWNYVAKGVVDPIPSQSGEAGKILETDGSSLSFVAKPAGLKNSGSLQSVWYARNGTATNINTGSMTEMMRLTLPQLTTACKLIVTFTEERREQTWNTTQGQYEYSADGGSNWSPLGYSDRWWDVGLGGSAIGARGSWIYHAPSGTYPIDFNANQTPVFRINGKKFGGSNEYQTNYESFSSIVAFKVES